MTKEHLKAVNAKSKHLVFKENQKGPYDLKNPYCGYIIVNKELHSSNSDRSCRHIEIKIENNLEYDVGDHLGVYPKNDTEIVEAIAKRLSLDLYKSFTLYSVNNNTKSN